MKIKFTVTLLLFICVFYTVLAGIADTKKTPDSIEPDLEEGCIRTCLDDYSKIAKCNINEIISAYILEANKEN